MASSNSRNFWTETEVHAMLQIFIDRNINKLFDGKRYKNNEIYKLVHDELWKQGCDTKTVEQIKNKWKALKSTYVNCKKHNNTSGETRRECEYFQQLDEILGTRPVSQLEGMDSAAEMTTEEIYIEITNDDATTDDVSDVLSVTSIDDAVATTAPSRARGKKRRSEREMDEEFFKQQRLLMRDFMENQKQSEEAAAEKRKSELDAMLATFKSCIQTIVSAQAPAPIMLPQMWNMPSTSGYVALGNGSNQHQQNERDKEEKN